MTRRLIFPALLIAGLAGGYAMAQGAEVGALAAAKREAEQATRRSERLEAQAAKATDEAGKARTQASAVAARIEAAEAGITAAETRIRIIENLRAEQRARLAERQEPVVRLTAALQTMARRPPALALVQPGSLDEVVHVRSLLASTLPIIRARTARLRAEVDRGNALRRQADVAVAALERSQQELKTQRVALARLEAVELRRSQSLVDSAMVQSDRALALGEEARDIGARIDTLGYQAKIRASLAMLPAPAPRPGRAPAPPPARAPRYILPVSGRLVTGMGEISDAGVHARGLTFEVAPGAAIVAPRDARVAYAGKYRGYGSIVILDHGGGWSSVITDLAAIEVTLGARVRLGAPLGRAGSAKPRITVELRRRGRPFPIAPLLAG